MSDLRIKHIIRSWLPKYNTGTLIETGSHEGEGIEAAFAYGFERVLSVEAHEEYYWKCYHRFYDQILSGKLLLYFGDSEMELLPMLELVHKRSTFWLDAHLPGLCPIMGELARIKEHHIKDHIILVDDVRDFGTTATANITLDQVKAAILEINPGYKFSFEDTGIENNVLVAQI